MSANAQQTEKGEQKPKGTGHHPWRADRVRRRETRGQIVEEEYGLQAEDEM